MTVTPVLISYLVWVAAVPALFRALGGVRAAPLAVLAGYLFLPQMNDQFHLLVPGRFLLLDKHSATGLGLLLGVLLFDRPALRRFRPHWADLPMLGFVVAPVFSLAFNHLKVWDPAVEGVWYRATAWGTAYLAGRLYLGHGEGVRRLASLLVLGGLVYAPLCVFEAFAGPKWYLARLLYGKLAREAEVFRLGGTRPEVFLQSGLEVAAWMALVTALATWLWLCRTGWEPPWRLPRWLPAAVLLAATLLCRGVYGYALLAAGATAVALMRLSRSKWPVVVLLLIPPAYVGARAAGAWDAKELVKASEFTGRSGTVNYRINAENTYLDKVRQHNLVWGFGGGMGSWATYDFFSRSMLWPDGWWLHYLCDDGLVGLTLFYLALFIVPAGLAAWRLPSRTVVGSPVSPAWGLVLFVALHSLDTLQNYDRIRPTVLIGGSLVGLYLTARKSSAGSDDRSSQAQSREGPAVVAPAGLAAALACLLYVFGHGPVAGQEGAKLVGGLGAALLFGASGAVGAWAASQRFTLARLAAFALLFAALGVSFNLALHPTTRPCASADILQGLALAGLAVAASRRLVPGAASAWVDSALVVAPLAVHVLLRDTLPVFPGSQYLYDAPGGRTDTLFPLCPWLTLAVLGARAAKEGPAVNLAAAAVLGASAWLLAGTDPTHAGFVKVPMNLPYAVLSAAAIGLAFGLTRAANLSEPVARASRWLGRNWLVFFYIHFAVAAPLGRMPTRSPWVVWPLLAAVSLAATWVISLASGRVSGVFKRPALWAVLLAVVAAIALTPGLSGLSVVAPAGLAGLAFASGYPGLASCVANARPPRARPAESPAPSDTYADVPAHPLAALLRLLILLLVLALPEIVSLALAPRPASTPLPHPSAGHRIPGR